MEKKEFSFIILHYKNINDTLECIKSIKRIKKNEEASIVIVDNNTLNEKEIDQLKVYTEDLVLLNENLGFAKGNNAGCKYAINKYHPNFLCVINNDTIIEQNDFLQRIEKCYKETNFDFMGPKIITDGGDSVNPFNAYSSLEEVEKKIKYHEKLDKVYNNKVLRILLSIYLGVKKLFMKPVHLKNGDNSQYDVALHGCAIIFSKNYYKKYDDIFYNETFLYHEEEFLNYRKNHDHLISYYDSDLEIFHKEGASLNESFKDSNYKKLIFRNKEILKSLYMLKEIMQTNRKI